MQVTVVSIFVGRGYHVKCGWRVFHGPPCPKCLIPETYDVEGAMILKYGTSFAVQKILQNIQKKKVSRMHTKQIKQINPTPVKANLEAPSQGAQIVLWL